MEIFVMGAPSLYDEVGEAVPQEGQNLMKASLFNLVILSQDPERALHCQQLIDIIIQRFPCRIIFLRADPVGQDFLRTVTGLQMIGTGTNRVYCDQITIEAAPNQLSKVPFLILPHIQADLPIYIVTAHDPSQDGVLLPQIQKYATRLIFDPENIESFHQFAIRILDFIQSSSGEIVDMNWARTKAWREAIVRAFSSEESVRELSTSKMIQITFAATPKKQKSLQEVQAIYLQAWLASRLGWNLVGVEREERGWRITYRRDHLATTISLVPKDSDILPPGAVFSFESMTYNDYHFLITHESESKFVKVHASNKERCEMPYSIFLHNYQNGGHLVNEIFYQPLSEHYKAMLEQLANNLWAKS
jgi:hypothetical protein